MLCSAVLERTGNPAYPYPVVFVDAVGAGGWSQKVAGRSSRRGGMCGVVVDPTSATAHLGDSISRGGHDVDDPVGKRGFRGSFGKDERVSGVSAEGLSTMVFPAAIAGRIFHAAICSG